jgi:hypothetical protein
MISTVLDKVLAVMLAIALLCGAGALWYADHERGLIQPLQDKYDNAAIAAKQAAADRDAAIENLRLANLQIEASNKAVEAAAASEASAVAAASDAHAALAAIAKTNPKTAGTLDMPLPPNVWGAIYNPTGEK